MSTGAIVAIVIAGVVVLALAAFFVSLELRRRRLRDRFGPEYDRVREDADGRRAAERQLTERERRHSDLGVRPISTMSRDRYTRHWALVQATFVDQPARAVDEADRLVVTIMEERGYPRGDFEDRLSMLSVEHGSVLHHYRTGHDIRARNAISQLSTEDLRAAMVHYRSLIEDLLEAKPETMRPRHVAAMPSGNVSAEPSAAREPEVTPEPAPEEPEPEPRRITPPTADTSMRPDAEVAERPVHQEAQRA